MDEYLIMGFVGILCFVAGILFDYRAAPRDLRWLFWIMSLTWVIIIPVTITGLVGVWARSAHSRLKERDANAG